MVFNNFAVIWESNQNTTIAEVVTNRSHKNDHSAFTHLNSVCVAFSKHSCVELDF